MQEIKRQFTVSHIATIVGACLVLAVLTYVQKPELFAWNGGNKKYDSPKYYAYEPKVYPKVAGASTDGIGPEVINEDGTITSAADAGEVLGITTQDLTADVNQITVSTVASTPESVEAYMHYSNEVELTAVNPIDFQTALTSNDQTQVQLQSATLKWIVDQLQQMSVPSDCVMYHKYKLLQYNAAIALLENFYQADSNPEYVSQLLSAFMQTQQAQDAAYEHIKQSYALGE